MTEPVNVLDLLKSIDGTESIVQVLEAEPTLTPDLAAELIVRMTLVLSSFQQRINTLKGTQP